MSWQGPGWTQYSNTLAAPPISIVVPLIDTTCQEGDPAILACKIRASGSFTVRWYKDNHECIDDNRYVKSIDSDGYVRLKISRSSYIDSGLYMVAIICNQTEVSSQCRVKINTSGIDRRKFTSNVAKQEFAAPTITKELLSTQVKVEKLCGRLKCRVYGHPIPKVKWFKGIFQLYPSTRVNMQFDFNGYASLIIRNVEPEDGGQYVALFENSVGSVTTSSTITVVPLTSESFSEWNTSAAVSGPPVIVNPPKSISVAEGQTVILECEVSSADRSKVTWLHNNGQLMTSERYKSYFDGRKADLRIYNASEIDKGIYTVIVENRRGSSTFSVSVDVIDSSGGYYPVYDIPERLITDHRLPLQPSTLDFKKDAHGEIDDSSIFDPELFKHLDKRNISKDDQYEAGIDTTPLKSCDKIAELEAKRQLGVQKKDLESVVEQNTTRNLLHIQELEKRNREKYQKRDTLAENEIDTKPLRDPAAFRFLEAEKIKKEYSGPPVDSNPIVDPMAFYFLELGNTQKVKDIQSGVDDSPIVDPSAFRYVEPQYTNRTSHGTSEVDTSSIISPSAFNHLNRPPTPKLELLESTVDNEPIIWVLKKLRLSNTKYIERPEPRKLRSNSPTIDTSPYVDLRPFKYLETSEDRREDVEPGVDETAYIPMDAFKYVEAEAAKEKDFSGPAIDTTPMIDSEAFRALEQKNIPNDIYSGPAIDDSSFIDPSVFRDLENSKIQTIDIADDGDEGFSPRIEGSLGDVNVFEGQKAVFSVAVVAVPYPDIKWQHNGKPLSPSSRIISNYNIANRIATLSVSQCTVDDSGLYELVATNKNGSLSAYGRLIVHEDSKIDETGFVPLDRFRSIEINS
ncbi:hypothetical protein ACOME3_006870 [Neoechinorhynchus agilis]